MPDQSGAFTRPNISKKDLESEPYRLNEQFRRHADQIAKTQGFKGPFSFGKGALTFQGPVTLSGGTTASLPQFDSNQAAKSGGLAVGAMYHTSAGVVMVVI